MRDVPIIDIPAKTQRALRLYIEKGDTVDPFLRCVLCNDLAGAVTRADKENLVALPIIAQYTTKKLVNLFALFDKLVQLMLR